MLSVPLAWNEDQREIETAMKTKQSTLKYLLTVTGKTKLQIALLTIVQALLGVAGILYALALKDIINAAVDADRHKFFFSVGFFTALVCLQVGLRAVNRHFDELTKSTLENRFKSRLFRCVLNKDFLAVSAVHSGEWLNRLTSDTKITADGLTNIVPGVCGMAVKLIGALIMIIALEPRFCYLIVPGGLLLIGFSYLFRKRIKLLHKQVQEKDGNLRVAMQDSLSSMLVVRSYAIEDTATAQAEQKMAEHKTARMRKNHFSNFCNIGFGMIMNGAYVVGAVFCGYGILTKTMSYGTFMAVLQLIGQVQAPFANISGYLPQWYAMLASAERLIEAESLADQSSRDAMPMNELKQRYANDFKGIGLEKACFTYQPPVRSLSDETEVPMPVVLRDITLAINKGEYVAFTGQSGCGKSTVMKLLLSLYQLDSGEKYVLTTSGKEPLNTKWQRLFAYVPQGNHLMSGTIREIITLPDTNRKDDDNAIQTALKIACADSFIAYLEHGIETVLGERGQGLSEGQMQRIAIARAIFSDAPILLLDESTSALDMQTEKQLLQNLKAMTDKTVVIVTHRPAALSICDRIFEFTAEGVKEIETGIS